MAVARAIVDLAHALGLDVVGEGVETAGQATALSKINCEFGQGFYFSKPVPADVAGKLLTRPL